jgi:uncharacterized protein YjaG (DUF416 family)
LEVNIENDYEQNIDNNIEQDNNFNYSIFRSIENDPERLDLILSDNSSSVDESTQNIGMEALDNGIPSSHVIYSEQMRSDHIIHNNYSIHMSGIDDVDYRMAYEYLIEYLDTIDRLIVQHQTLSKLENIILPLNNELEVQASIIESEIISLFEVLNQFI